MKKGNIIDLLTYLKHDDSKQVANSPISTELETAIRHLILRLRELGPIQ